jgi:hypothetical protein
MEPMDHAGSSGSLSIKYEGVYHTLYFGSRGWIAADMVQYLGDLYRAEDPRVGILKLLGYTMEVSGEPPPRLAEHWVEIDFGGRILSTNSDLLRKVVKRIEPDTSDPYHGRSIDRIYAALDSLDFKVELYG